MPRFFKHEPPADDVRKLEKLWHEFLYEGGDYQPIQELTGFTHRELMVQMLGQETLDRMDRQDERAREQLRRLLAGKSVGPYFSDLNTN